MRQTTPKEITPALRDWVKDVTGGTIEVVRPRPLLSRGGCYLNCLAYVALNGGEIVPGWVVWQASHILELEAHCVVRLDTGELFDPTSPADREQQVLFVPDLKNPAPRFRGRYIENYENVIFPDTVLKPRRHYCLTRNIYAVLSGKPTLDARTLELLRSVYGDLA